MGSNHIGRWNTACRVKPASLINMNQYDILEQKAEGALSSALGVVGVLWKDCQDQYQRQRPFTPVDLRTDALRVRAWELGTSESAGQGSQSLLEAGKTFSNALEFAAGSRDPVNAATDALHKALSSLSAAVWIAERGRGDTYRNIEINGTHAIGYALLCWVSTGSALVAREAVSDASLFENTASVLGVAPPQGRMTWRDLAHFFSALYYEREGLLAEKYRIPTAARDAYRTAVSMYHRSGAFDEAARASAVEAKLLQSLGDKKAHADALIKQATYTAQAAELPHLQTRKFHLLWEAAIARLRAAESLAQDKTHSVDAESHSKTAVGYIENAPNVMLSIDGDDVDAEVAAYGLLKSGETHLETTGRFEAADEIHRTRLRLRRRRTSVLSPAKWISFGSDALWGYGTNVARLLRAGLVAIVVFAAVNGFSQSVALSSDLTMPFSLLAASAFDFFAPMGKQLLGAVGLGKDSAPMGALSALEGSLGLAWYGLLVSMGKRWIDRRFGAG